MDVPSTCPAWRNQKGIETNARSCKHLAELLGEAYEGARVAWRRSTGGSGSSNAKPSSSVKPASTAKPALKAKPASKAKAESAKPAPKRRKVEKDPYVSDEEDKLNAVKEEDGEDDAEGEDQDGEKDDDMDVDGEGSFFISSFTSLFLTYALLSIQLDDQADPLACISGQRPKIILEDGEEKEVKSKTSKTGAGYKCKRVDGHFYWYVHSLYLECPGYMVDSTFEHLAPVRHGGTKKVSRPTRGRANILLSFWERHMRRRGSSGQSLEVLLLLSPRRQREKLKRLQRSRTAKLNPPRRRSQIRKR